MIKKKMNLFLRNAREGFFNSLEESNHEYIPPLYTKNFTAFFQKLLNGDQYLVSICFLAQGLTIFDNFVFSGHKLDIKKSIYEYMLQHKDNLLRR